MKCTTDYAGFLASQNDERGVNFFKEIEQIEFMDKESYFISKEIPNE